MPRFPRSRYSDHELPGVVADVCRDLDPRDPRSVSQARFDAGRTEAGHPQAPSAKRTAARLHLSWEEVKRFALDSGRDADRTVGALTRRAEELWLTPEVCIAALRTVARKINKDGELTPGRYEIEVEQMLTANRRRYLHGRRLVMPTVGQIERRLGRWPKALQQAGLQPPELTRQAEGVPWIDAIELCLEATGCLPSEKTVIMWFEINDLSLKIHHRGMRYPEEVEKLRARRAAAGKWTPSAYTSPRERSDMLSVVDVDGPKRRVRGYDDDRVLAALVQFVRDRRGLPQTRRDYMKWAAEKGDAPAASSMSGNERPGFAAYREQARLIVREEENGQR